MRQLIPYTSAVAKRMIPLLGAESTNDLQAFDMSEQDLTELLEYLDNVSFSCLCVDDTGEPFACFGAMFEEMNVARTFMLCTEDCFSKHGKWVTLQIVKYLRRNKATFPDVRLELYSGNQNSRAHKWFEMMGFERDDGFSHEKQVKYVYRDGR